MEPGSFPQWKGLFDWSMRYSDGTRPSAGDIAKEFTPERRKWLEEALTHYMQDFACRMKEIKDALDKPEDVALTEAAASVSGQQQGADNDTSGSAPQASDQGQKQGAAAAKLSAAALLEQREALLDELMEIVESIDFARDLHKIGGLPTLMDLLACPYPSLRWRAAEVAAICVQNNFPVQKWFLEGGLLPRLVALLPDVDPTVRSKALLGISALVRHFPPGLEAFRAQGGVAAVSGKAAAGESRSEQRKAMLLLVHMLNESPQRAVDASEVAAYPGLLPALATIVGATPGSEPDENPDMRQAALGLLVEVGKTPSAWPAVCGVPGLAGAAQRLLERHAKLDKEDQEAEAEQAELAQELGALLARSAPPPEPAAYVWADAAALAAAEGMAPEPGTAEAPKLLTM